MTRHILSSPRHRNRAPNGLLILVVLLLSPLLLLSRAGAATNAYSRTISMSSSTTSATSVTYHVSFKADSAYSLRTLLVDFCSNSPLAGENCTGPTGFTVGASPTGANVTINGSAAAGTWTPSSQNSGRTFLYTGSVGVAVNVGDLVAFDITSVTNPSTLATFYGRIFSYTTATPTYSDISTDVYSDKGSVALSTANTIGFSFDVPESLSFCVYKTTCGDSPALSIGHGANIIIDSSQIDTDTAKFSVATNAKSGVVVYLHGATLKHNTDSIPPINSGSGVQALMTAGTAAFGVKVSPTTGPIAAATAYADGGGNSYTFDNAMTPPGAYGVAITQQASPGPITSNVLTVTFGATASKVTPAGIYTTTMSLIAVATF